MIASCSLEHFQEYLELGFESPETPPSSRENSDCRTQFVVSTV